MPLQKRSFEDCRLNALRIFQPSLLPMEFLGLHACKPCTEARNLSLTRKTSQQASLFREVGGLSESHSGCCLA